MRRSTTYPTAHPARTARRAYDGRMLRTILLVMVVGCGTDAAHEVVGCGSGWDAFYSASNLAGGCERQCEQPPANYGPRGSGDPVGPTCTIIDPSIDGGHGGPTGCEYFTFDDGSRGCCLANGTSVVFAECEAQ